MREIMDITDEDQTDQTNPPVEAVLDLPLPAAPLQAPLPPPPPLAPPTGERTVFNTYNTYVPPAPGSTFSGSGQIVIVDHGDWELYHRPDLTESIDGRAAIVPQGTIFCRRISDGVDWYELSRQPENFPIGSILCTCLKGSRGFTIQGVFANKQLVFPGIQRLIEIKEYNGSVDNIHRAFENLCYDPTNRTVGSFDVTEEDLLSYAAKQKSKIEQGGITVNGMPFSTDRTSQAMITQTVVGLQLLPDMEIIWKNPDGSSTMLTGPFITIMAKFVVTHVSKTFAVLAEVNSGIKAKELITYQQIDDYLASHITTSYTFVPPNAPSA